MDAANNSGLIVVTLDDCNPTSVEQSDAAMKADCLYTVAVMAPDGVLVPTSEGNTIPPSSHNTELLNLTPSLPVVTEQSSPINVETSEDLGDNYYHLLLNYLNTRTFPDYVSESRRIMISRRSRHYQIVNGKLFYGHNHPKKVVADHEMRQSLMQNVHVIKENGVHLGVQKMHSKLKKEYFWCGMYVDLTKFVRHCSKCMDVDLPASCGKNLAHKQKVEDFGRLESNENNAPRVIKQGTHIWTQVELRVSGPFSDKYVLTIADPCSHWITAKVISSTDLEDQAAQFLISTFCQFGFAQFSTVGFKPDMITTFLTSYNQKFLEVTSSIPSNEATIQQLTTPLEESNNLCPWVADLLKSLLSTFPQDWPSQISKYLFEFRSRTAGNVKKSPFKLMFLRDPLTVISENKGLRYSRRLQMKSQCEPVKVRQRSPKTVCPRKKTYRSKSPEISCSENEDDPLCIEEFTSNPQPIAEDEVPEVREARANTVATVQALLSATKEERSRRGQYQRYSADLRDEMASFALEHGSLLAVKHFNDKLGISISESTIRNFAKNYQTYSPDMQDQIGCFAVSHSIEATIQHFAELGIEVRPYTVRKFKKRYSSKFPPEKSQETDSSKKRTIFETNLRDEIGQYASLFGVAKAIAHFSDKLHIPVKEVSVRKFKKCYQEKQSHESHIITQTITTCQAENNLHGEPMDVSFNVVNSTPQTLVFNQQPYQSLISPITFHQNPNSLDPTSYQQQTNPTLVFSQATFQSPTTYTSTFTSLQQHDSTQILTSSDHEHANQMILSQHPILITQTQNDENNMTVHLDNLTNLPTFQTQLSNQQPSSINFLQPSTISYGHPISSENIVTQNQHESNFTIIDNNPPSQVIRVIRVESEQNPNIEQNIPAVVNSKPIGVPPNTVDVNSKMVAVRTSSVIQSTVSKPKQKTKSPPKKKVALRIKGRGNYTTYSPEVRADIGKFAATHGNNRAIIHFRGILGHDLPESTVRGLKEKYLAKVQLSKSKSKNSITSLGFAPRGRPMRLGKYDDMVRQCIRDLVSNGERVSSFLAIATAKQVLMEHEPTLLAENGGNVKLTTNWAKSFLKRIGVHNNS